MRSFDNLLTGKRWDRHAIDAKAGTVLQWTLDAEDYNRCTYSDAFSPRSLPMVSSSNHPTSNKSLQCPTDPALYRQFLTCVLQHKESSSHGTAGIADFSDYLERAEYIAGGGYGEVYKGHWENIDSSLESVHHSLPPIALKIMRVSIHNANREKANKVSPLSKPHISPNTCLFRA